jgi:hypothetical protein
LFFEAPNLVANRGLGQVQPLCCPGKTPSFFNGHESTQKHRIEVHKDIYDDL